MIQYGWSVRAKEILKQNMLACEAVVIRDSVEVTIPASNVVPGDVIVLRAGDCVTADTRLIVANSFIL